MVTRFRFCNSFRLLALALAFWGYPAAAFAQKDLNFKGIYEVRYVSLPLGKIGIEAREDGTHYQVTADILSSGLVNLFSKHSSHTTVNATGADHTYTKVAYLTDYRIKKKKKSVKLTYVDGKVTEEVVVPPDNRATRPAVPEDMKTGSNDPLSFLLLTRRQLAAALESKAEAMTARVYDGRRLMQVDMVIKGKKTLKDRGKNQPVIAVKAKRKPLSGYTASELKDYKSNDPALVAYFSDDDRLFPVRLELPFLLGMLSATLVKECVGAESCLLGNKE